MQLSRTSWPSDGCKTWSALQVFQQLGLAQGRASPWQRIRAWSRTNWRWNGDEMEMKWRWNDYDNDKTTVTMYYDAVHDALLFWCLLESFGDETQWTRHLPSVEAGWWPPMMKGSKWEPYGSNMIIYWFHMVIYEIIIDSIYWFHIVIIIMD